ncbi:serine/threonine-protein phosphatase 6 regulatory ankyrin repeat subunit C [Chanos chanos]|uniref:Serine/threonine-protein phosphatase 6 regulatory ankyrin repeat subunit C n=1 Tax=Chanos chanos TaxID=29144 RepID=A0A6J2V3C5_CHACN|nr:serine/threonine-protein phosphatase 6 regulatory ankyrin repeat subunit C-like [Chanos chanos]
MGVLSISDQAPLVQAIFSRNADEVRVLLQRREVVTALDPECRTPLHAAAWLGDVHIMDMLIAAGANVNAKDKAWLTPLHRATASRNERAVRLLLQMGADVMVRDKLWQTALHIAAANQATRCAEVLLAQNSSLNTADRTGRTALHHAAQCGHQEMVKLLLNRGATLSASDKKERQPIHWAAYLGHVEVVKLLVSQGADRNCKDKRGYTPLHVAAASGHVEVVKCLLRHGAEIDELNAFGNTALHVACYMGQEAVANELVNHGANVNQPNYRGYTPLHLSAVSTNGALCLELLVNNGADVNMQSKEGKSPLHMAAIHGRFTRSQILIQNGAEIDCVDTYGNTPLHVAGTFGHELLISTLMTNGADTARQGIHGMFPLHLAVLYGYSDCCRKLLSSGQLYSIVLTMRKEHVLWAGFDINTPDKFGRTCLHAAASGGNIECLNLLLSSGADMEKKDKFGRTPLHYAGANGWYQCVMTLVAAGAEVNVPDYTGCTPLHYSAASTVFCRLDRSAVSSGQNQGEGPSDSFRCVEYLLESGADPSVSNSNGYSALHYAAAHGNRQILQLLLQMCLNKGRDLESHSSVSPLHLAAEAGHWECVCVLAESGLNVNVCDSAGRSVLYVACQRGRSRCVELLLHHRASCLLTQPHYSWSPLHVAAASGHADCVRILLLSVEKADFLNMTDTQGQTPLMLAVLGGHSECVKLLLERGALPNITDRKGRTALHRGAVMGREDCVAFLLAHNASALIRDIHGHTALHLAASCGHTAILSNLLCGTNKQDQQDPLTDLWGYTPTHWAAYHGHEECLEVALELRPGSIQEGNLFSPLHCALINGHSGCAELLLATASTPIVNVSDAKGRTPLHAAAFAENVTGLQLVLCHGADINAVDCSGCSALMVAANNGRSAAVAVLLHRAKADLSLLDQNKNTALHLACSKAHEMCAMLILREIHNPVLINATNSMLQMPLHIAARNGLATVVQALLSRGATVLGVDEEGHTPALACASNKAVADCLALILSTMKPSSSSSSFSSSPSLNLLKHCGITAARPPMPGGRLRNGYSKDHHGTTVGLDGCLTE